MRIRNLTLGEGIPKICVPVMGKTKEEVRKNAERILVHQPDLVEWRCDFLNQPSDVKNVLEILEMLRQILGEMPLLFTIRTKAEGGEKEMDVEDYREVCRSVIASKMADAVDVELFLGENLVRELVQFAHQHEVKVFGSNHDFVKTPDEEELVERLCKMQEYGCDVAKIAVMPKDSRDVLTLLSATETMRRCHPSTPVITMSMGATGVISRLTGEVFGSALTFGMVGTASAPGQIPVEELREILTDLHQYSKGM